MTRASAILPSFLALAVLTGGCGYNPIQTMDEQVNQAKGQIETQLQRRADLVPNLVETVKGVAKQESTVFTSIADVAGPALGRGADRETSARWPRPTPELTQGLGRLLAIVENYPELRSSESFQQLQDQLEGTENRISVARQDYNTAVGELQRLHPPLPLQPDGQDVRPGAEGVLRGGAGSREQAPKVKF